MRKSVEPEVIEVDTDVRVDLAVSGEFDLRSRHVEVGIASSGIVPADARMRLGPGRDRMIIFHPDRSLPLGIIGKSIAGKSIDDGWSVTGEISVHIGAIGIEGEIGSWIEPAGKFDALAPSASAVDVHSKALDLGEKLNRLPVDKEAGQLVRQNMVMGLSLDSDLVIDGRIRSELPRNACGRER